MPHRHRIPLLDSDRERESRGAREGRSSASANTGVSAAARTILGRASATHEGARHRAQLVIVPDVMLISFDNGAMTTNIKHAAFDEAYRGVMLYWNVSEMRAFSQCGDYESLGAYFIPGCCVKGRDLSSQQCACMPSVYLHR